MVANNGCHPLRACNALRVLYDGSIRRGVLNASACVYIDLKISSHLKLIFLCLVTKQSRD
jgi:hypothetical protein